jgi:hypothetical protein
MSVFCSSYAAAFRARLTLTGRGVSTERCGWESSDREGENWTVCGSLLAGILAPADRGRFFRKRAHGRAGALDVHVHVHVSGFETGVARCSLSGCGLCGSACSAVRDGPYGIKLCAIVCFRRFGTALLLPSSRRFALFLLSRPTDRVERCHIPTSPPLQAP